MSIAIASILCTRMDEPSHQILHRGVIVLHPLEMIGHGLAGDALVRPARVGAVDGDVGHADRLPVCEFLAPIVRAALRGRDPYLDADLARVPAGFLDVAAQLVE